MTKYQVLMPTTGQLYAEVEAANKEDAIQKAYEEFDRQIAAGTLEHNWEYTEHVTDGNVCHAMLSSVDVEKLS